MRKAKRLYQVNFDLVGLPHGAFRYASMRFAQRNLPPHLVDLVERMAEGIVEPRITYHCRYLEAGGRFGHGRWHCDGKQEAGELHRLLTLGGVPTLGIIREAGADDEVFQVLHAGTVWEYDGLYEHKARRTEEACTRMMLRVSQTEMRYRNHWSRQ